MAHQLSRWVKVTLYSRRDVEGVPSEWSRVRRVISPEEMERECREMLDEAKRAGHELEPLNQDPTGPFLWGCISRGNRCSSEPALKSWCLSWEPWLPFDRETYTHDQAAALLISLGIPNGDIRPAARSGLILLWGGDAWGGYTLTGQGLELYMNNQPREA